MSLRDHYTPVQFGSQVAQPHRFARPNTGCIQSGTNHSQFSPSSPARGSISPSSHLRQARVPPWMGQHRGTISSSDQLCRPEPICRGPPPRCALAGLLVLIPLVPPWFNGSPGLTRGALPLTVTKPQSTPPIQAGVSSGGSSGIETLEDSSPATAMAHLIKGDQTGVKSSGVLRPLVAKRCGSRTRVVL